MCIDYVITWQERTERELKTNMEPLKQELSNLQSEVMMKATQNQQLSEDKASLTKLINKLKTVSFPAYTVNMTHTN